MSIPDDDLSRHLTGGVRADDPTAVHLTNLLR
jgi:hypothetical protein